jgi:UvrD/REP helicase N-terminal domain
MIGGAPSHTECVVVAVYGAASCARPEHIYSPHRDAFVCPQTKEVMRSHTWFKTHEAADHQPPMLARTASKYYERRMKQCNAVDFDEVLVLTERLFASNPEVLRIARQLHTHLLVDEFQVR